eukprot:augustus_masked-scaffold_6-processed-gene-4.9-mRNA-1 protein AED:0.11 eAED:0.11 QI:0/0/0/1/1/1/2/0/814
MDVSLGQEVGYSVRFNESTSAQTRLKFLTDGMLLREAMLDKMFSKYHVVIIDEAHERTISTDILLGLLKDEACQAKVVIMSATLDSDRFQTYYTVNGDKKPPLLKIPGRTFPVEIFYTPQPEKDYLEATRRTIFQIHRYEDQGDILVFLTGQQEIEQIYDEILNSENPKDENLVPIPLYGSLTAKQQSKVFDDVGDGNRKVVLATNIAETSLTIDGIVYVVDSGFSKQKVFNPRARVESLLVTPISQAAANQRAGRAGRTREGKAFRLYTEKSFNEDLPEQTHPEILRSNLASVVLTLLEIGIQDLVHFDFIDPPAPETLMRALEALNYLDALDDEGEITETGAQMAKLPLKPELAKMLLASAKFGCISEIASICSLLSVPNIFIRSSKNSEKVEFGSVYGDHFALLNAYHSYKQEANNQGYGDQNSRALRGWCEKKSLQFRSLAQADKIRMQLVNMLRKMKFEISSASDYFGSNVYYEKIGRSILSGYFMQVAHLERLGGSKDYKTVKDNQIVQLHPSTCLNYKPQWNSLVALRNELREFINKANCNPILVRLAWHDSGTFSPGKDFPECGGANASIINDEELAHGANAGLFKAVNYLKPFKKKYPDVSWADLIQLASAESIALAGGPEIDMIYGRLDSNYVPKEGNLPDAEPPFKGEKSAGDHLRNVFFRMGFNEQEIVALSGAHTLGRAFKERSGVTENGYGSKKGTKYTSGETAARSDGSEGVGMPGGRSWTQSWLKFDNSYFKYAKDAELLWLSTDEALRSGNFKEWYDLYAQDEVKFFKDYAAAHKKLSELGSKFQTPGGISLKNSKL